MKDPRRLLPETVRTMWEALATKMQNESAVRGIYNLATWIGTFYPSITGERLVEFCLLLVFLPAFIYSFLPRFSLLSYIYRIFLLWYTARLSLVVAFGLKSTARELMFCAAQTVFSWQTFA